MNNRIEFVTDSALTNIAGTGASLKLTQSGSSVTLTAKLGPITVPGPIQIGNNYYLSGFKVNVSRSFTFRA